MVHQTHGLAVSTRRGHTEVTGHVLLRIASLLVADEQHRALAKTADTAHQGLVVIATAVAMELDPVVAEHLDEIQRAGAMGMARNLDLLGRREALKDLLTATGCQGLQLVELLTDIHFGISGQLTDLLNLLLQLHQGLLELEQGTTGHGDDLRRRRPEAKG